ncbi:A/G-specific adenine glycosylase [Striga asiatica]|uniref:A/G-specific adenine glycosylase n=1 Tax=Striga asiatica TaxID=4170 RepID=A0A5A7Q052_STRAF|nr:A/G-specific adenine glycosylase [Striga asiatica]
MLLCDHNRGIPKIQTTRSYHALPRTFPIPLLRSTPSRTNKDYETNSRNRILTGARLGPTSYYGFRSFSDQISGSRVSRSRTAGLCLCEIASDRSNKVLDARNSPVLGRWLGIKSGKESSSLRVAIEDCESCPGTKAKEEDKAAGTEVGT